MPDIIYGCSLRAVRPSAVVFGGGVWFVWSGLRDFHGYRKALAGVLAELRALAARLLWGIQMHKIYKGGTKLNLKVCTTLLWGGYNKLVPEPKLRNK